MKRWIVTMHWYEDRGMYETRHEAKEFTIRAKDYDDAVEVADKLQNRVGAFEYDIQEA